MGLATSKDASGHVVLPGGAPGGLPPDSLDYAGRELRDRLDECLNANMWYATGLGLALAVPVTIKYKTQKPLFAAALISPLADMTYSARRRRRRRPPTRRNACCSLARPTWRSRPPRQTAPAAPGGGHGSRLRVPHSARSPLPAPSPSAGAHRCEPQKAEYLAHYHALRDRMSAAAGMLGGPPGAPPGWGGVGGPPR